MTKSIETASEVPFPQILSDVLNHSQGIILMVGNRHSRVSSTFSQIEKRIVESSRRQGLWILREPVATVAQKTFHPVTYEKLFESQEMNHLKNADVLFFDNLQFDHEFSQAVNFYEEGRLVFLHISAPSLMAALHRIFGFLPSTGGSHQLWRWVDGLLLGLSQTRVVNSSGDSVYAHEIVLSSPEVKALLRDQGLAGFEDFMRNASENSGVLTLNQSLIQLLIRRRIEIKTAFEISRDPKDLDLMLKKVGL